MADVDIKTQSIKNYMAEFLKEIDSSFLNPNFDSYFIFNSILIS